MLLRNDQLTVEIDALGGELRSIRTPDGTEYLWQGDPAYWKSRAVNIFPYVARLWGGKYTYQGKTYALGNHGFVRHTVRRHGDGGRRPDPGALPLPLPL